MKEIPLTQSKVALVDDGDFEFLSQWKWCASSYGRDAKIYYAVARVSGRNAKMHRLITAAPAGSVVDHKDRNGLNNQRSNLRVTTQRGNNANSIRERPSNAGYRGVFRYPQAGLKRPFLAKIGGTPEIRLGCFATAEEAARVYDEVARAWWGEFARLNFPNENEQPALVNAG